MKIVTHSRKFNIIKVHAEVNTISELEEYLKTFKQKSRKINDFICFNADDIPIVEKIIKGNSAVSHSELRNIHLRSIFKYRTRGQLNYWLCRGWNIEKAKQNVHDWQSKLGKATAKTRFSNPDYKKKLSTCIEYWLTKGYPLPQAQQKLKERQTTFTLKKCMKKHGAIKGKQIYEDRQRRWIDSLYKGKTESEIIAFERSKHIAFGRASKSSLEVFLPLITWLKEESIITDISDYHIGYEDKEEYCIYNSKHEAIFFYDFVMPKLKIIIEFNGRAWHPNGDIWVPLSYVNQSKEQIIAKEKLKEQTAVDNRFRLLTIWDTESPETNLEKCKQFIRL